MNRSVQECAHDRSIHTCNANTVHVCVAYVSVQGCKKTCAKIKISVQGFRSGTISWNGELEGWRVEGWRVGGVEGHSGRGGEEGHSGRGGVEG